jgi:hypothetical protein
VVGSAAGFQCDGPEDEEPPMTGREVVLRLAIRWVKDDARARDDDEDNKSKTLSIDKRMAYTEQLRPPNRYDAPRSLP